MRLSDFIVDPAYLIGADNLHRLALVLGLLIAGLWLKTIIRNGKAGWHLSRYTFLDILRTRLYWVILGCAVVASVGLVLVLFRYAYPEMKKEGVSGMEVVTQLYSMSDGDQSFPRIDDPAAAARDLKEGVTLFSSLLLEALYVFFGSLLAIFVGMGLLAGELERRSIYTLISKPLDRMMIFFGKLGGCYAALAFYAVILFSIDAALLAYFGLGVRLNILPAFLVASLVPLMLASLTLYLSTIAKALQAGFWAIILMFASNNIGMGLLGFILKSLLRLQDRQIDWIFLFLPPQRQVGLYSVNFLIEDPLTRFMITRGFPLTNDPAILALPVVYLALILLIAYATFSRQEFN